MSAGLLICIADALLALDGTLDSAARTRLTALAHGRSLSELRLAVLKAADPAAIRSAAELLAANEGGCGCSGDEPPEPTASQHEAAADRLSREALAPFIFNPTLREYLNALGCRLAFPDGDRIGLTK